MLKLNRDYSDYTDETDVNYPEGKAVNASTSESYDGTPLLAEFMNDVNAAHIAMYEKAHGNRDGINGHADTQKASQFADAVAKYTDDKMKAHADKRGLADGVHGATSEATPGQIVSRDQFGRAKVAAPVENDDIANKKWVLEAIYPVGSLYWSSKATNPSQLFGGTWVQIKDCFVWAKGDSDAINATGGSKTVTLREANMPPHSHSFTPSGSFKMDSHKHSLNGHTHSYTPEGSVSLSLSFKEMSGTIIGAGTSYINGSGSNEIFASASGVFSVSGPSKRHGIGADGGLDYNPVGGARQSVSFSATPTLDSAIASFSGTASQTGYSYVDTGYSSPSGTFSGATGTTSSYGGDSNGNASSFNIMNPYITKYCWERID